MQSVVRAPNGYPVDAVVPQLDAALAAGPRAVLQAPPGAGKSTRVPLALLDSEWLAGRSILMLEPRRLAARAVAAWMAELLGEPMGKTVGYRVRFENRVGADTRIEVVTEGILTRRLQSDPELAGVGLVIFDEFHERHLHSELALALCRDIQRGLRDDLRLLVMSATLDGRGLADTLDAAFVESQGRRHPVAVRHLPRDPEGPIWQSAAEAVRRALEEQATGDVLLFLPGSAEIRRCAERLSALPVRVHPLYGDLPLAAQEQAIRPDPEGRRKVVLATNIAETSLTIEGVSTVIDSGWARAPRFDPRSGLTRLETVRISRAAAEQRAGRAGRLGPGTCYRLYSETTAAGLVPFDLPEIATADLAPLALELAAWGVLDSSELPWLQAPPAAALAQARDLLRELGALDGSGRITPVGRAMGGLPVHPRLARMLLASRDEGLGALACDLAALLSERDLIRGEPADRSSDVAARLETLAAFRQQGRRGARAHGADAAACAAVERSATQFRRLLGTTNAAADGTDAAGSLLLLAYPDRLAQRRSGSESRFLLSGGRGARLDAHDPNAGHRYLAVGALQGEGREGRIRLAAPVDMNAIETRLGHRFVESEEVGWDAGGERVVAERVRRLGAVVLERAPLSSPDPEAVKRALLEAVRQQGMALLPWDEASRSLQARLNFLRSVAPEHGWPDVSDAALLQTLEAWLPPWLEGISSRAGLRQLDLGAALRARLDWEALQRLEEGAPERMRVPSGHLRRIDYGEASPVLAVKLQELFGLAETPTVAWGRVPLTLHLLSPAGRPIQVTRDLKGFWERTYPEVRKELKGRYPKHPWPEDPWSASPTAGVKRRKT